MRNVVLIAVDTLRADHLGCYGHPRPTSPRLDALAAQGTVLEALWSASNFTAPAFTSLFTGLAPQHHGVFEFTRKVTSSPLRPALDAAGVRTGGVVTFRFFQHLLGDIWGPLESVTDGRSFDYSKELPRAVTAGAIEWLETRGRQGPFCLFLHYDAPHLPYRLPDEYATFFDTVDPAAVDPDVRDAVFPQDRERLGAEADEPMQRLIRRLNHGLTRLDDATRQWLLDKYDACIRYNDACIGEVLDALRDLHLADETIVCVISDHGEEFLEHGGFSHGNAGLPEEVIRTVGIVHDPALTGGRRLATPLSQIGLLPTLLQRAGLALPDVAAGAAFAPLLAGTVPDEPQSAPPVFCQGKFKAAVRQGRHKLVAVAPSPF